MDSINKKGILMTLGMVFVSLTILAFANVILNNSETSESRIKEFAETERLYNLDRSLSSSISRIMKYPLNNTHKISFDGNVIDFKTEFQNITENPEVEIMRQINITNERLKKQAYVNFSKNYPLFGKNGNIVIDSSLGNPNSTVFYVDQNKSIFVEYVSYPANMIFLAGINEGNVKKINFTYKSDFMEPLLILANMSEVFSGACANCIEFVFNNYYLGSLINRTSYNISSTDTPPSLSALPFGIPFGFVQFFDLRVAAPTWINENRTLAINWVNLTYLLTSDAEEGLAITLPDVLVYNLADPVKTFDFAYYGYGDPAVKRLIGDTKIELQIFLEGDALKHEGTLVGPLSYSIDIPLLDTSGEGLRIEYIDQG